LKKCAFLDPRFKDLDPFVCDGERSDIIEAVKLYMIEFVNEEELHNDSAENLSSNETQSSPPKKRKLAAYRRGTSSGHDIVQSEMRRYVDEDMLDYDSDPLCGGVRTKINTLL
jgi:hypothetical protein